MEIPNAPIVFPMFDPDEVNGIISLQEFFMDLNVDNYEESKLLIVESDWIKYRKEVAQIARTIILSVRYRPKSISLYKDFLQFLVSNANEGNSLDFLKRDVLKTLFRSLYYIKPFPHESSNLCFLFECMEMQIFSKNEIVLKIKKFFLRCSQFLRSIFWLFCWFAPEIEEIDPKLYEQVYTLLQKASEKPGIPAFFRNFIINIENNKENNWAIVRTTRNQNQHKLTSISIIRRDSLFSLRKLASFPAFNVQTRIIPSMYGSCSFLQSYPTLLQIAALFGSIKSFKYLLLSELSIFDTDQRGVTLSQFSIAGGNLDIIRYCLELGCNFDYGCHMAALFHQNNLLEWFNALFDKSLDSPDIFGLNVLHNAAESNCIKSIKFCIENGVNVNSKSSDGWTALRIAVRHGNIDTVRYLLSIKGIDINLPTNSGVTPIHLAAKYGDVQIARLLISMGIDDINVKTNEGLTPLFYAASNDQTTMVKFLLTIPGIDPNIQAKDGTSLHYAVQRGSFGIVELLLSHPDIDTNIMFGDGFTALHIAVKKKYHQIIKLLVDHPNTNVNASSSDGITPLHMATKRGREKCVQILLESSRVDVNAFTNKGLTPLMRAIIGGYSKTVKSMIKDPRVNINLQADNGVASILFAALHNRVEILESLLECNGINVNIQDNEGKTALHYSCSFKNVEFTRMLLTNQSLNPNIASKNGVTPLMSCIVHNCPECLSLLLVDQRIDMNIITNVYTDKISGEYSFFDIANAYGHQTILDMIHQYGKPKKEKSCRI